MSFSACSVFFPDAGLAPVFLSVCDRAKAPIANSNNVANTIFLTFCFLPNIATSSVTGRTVSGCTCTLVEGLSQIRCAKAKAEGVLLLAISPPIARVLKCVHGEHKKCDPQYPAETRNQEAPGETCAIFWPKF